MTEDQKAMFEALRGPLKRSVEQAVSEAMADASIDKEQLRAVAAFITRFEAELDELHPDHLSFLRTLMDDAVRKQVNVLTLMIDSAWTFRTLKRVARAVVPIVLAVSGWLVWFVTTDLFQAWWGLL